MKKPKRTLLIFIIKSILLAAFLFSGYILCDYLIELYQLKNTQGAMADIYDQSVAKESDAGEQEFTLEHLQEVNEDIVGWISIEGTSIHYPVAQADDNEYYLTHSVYKEESSAGTIFMDYRNCPAPLGSHTVLYGHNMRNGTMFRDLTSYKKEAFCKENPYVTYSNKDGISKWEVFSAYVTGADDNYIETDFRSEGEFGQFLERISTKSLYHTGCQVERTDKVITLSTCSYEFDDARMVVHAKLIE